MDEISYLKIIVPATISIAILFYFQYFHQYFVKALDMNRKQIVLSDVENFNVKTKTVFKKILDTTITVFHVHLNKVEIMLVAISVMNKVRSIYKCH